MISCVIIDDEPLARKGIREYISDVDFLHLAGEYDNPLKATEMISRGEAQLLSWIFKCQRSLDLSL